MHPHAHCCAIFLRHQGIKPTRHKPTQAWSFRTVCVIMFTLFGKVRQVAGKQRGYSHDRRAERHYLAAGRRLDRR